jgi:hypothetical protein
MIDVGKDGKADLNHKSQGDTAGTGWVKATKEQIKMHVIVKSDCMTDGRYIPERGLPQCVAATHRSLTGDYQPLCVCETQT